MSPRQRRYQDKLSQHRTLAMLSRTLAHRTASQCGISWAYQLALVVILALPAGGMTAEVASSFGGKAYRLED